MTEPSFEARCIALRYADVHDHMVELAQEIDAFAAQAVAAATQRPEPHPQLDYESAALARGEDWPQATPAKPDATDLGRHSDAAKIWYEQFDGKPQSPGWIITAYDKAIAEARRAGETKGIEAMRELAGFIAINGCLMPPDGGEPTEDERELSAEIARRIYAATAPTSEPDVA